QRADAQQRVDAAVLLARPGGPVVAEVGGRLLVRRLPAAAVLLAGLRAVLRGRGVRAGRLLVDHGVLEDGERAEERDADRGERDDVAVLAREAALPDERREEEAAERQQQDRERVPAGRRALEERAVEGFHRGPRSVAEP